MDYLDESTIEHNDDNHDEEEKGEVSKILKSIPHSILQEEEFKLSQIGGHYNVE